MREEKYLSESALQDLINDGVSLASLDRFTATAKTLAELNAEAQKLVPVDMEALVGMDCVFFEAEDDLDPLIGELEGVGVQGYLVKNSLGWPHCRPRPDYWYYWRNFESITGCEAKIECLQAAGFKLSITENRTAFQVYGPAEGRCWREDAE